MTRDSRVVTRPLNADAARALDALFALTIVFFDTVHIVPLFNCSKFTNFLHYCNKFSEIMFANTVSDYRRADGLEGGFGDEDSDVGSDCDQGNFGG